MRTTGKLFIWIMEKVFDAGAKNYLNYIGHVYNPMCVNKS